MGRELMREQPVFAASIREMDTVLKSLEHAPDWTLEGNPSRTELSLDRC
jgi:hypothetical protein